MGILEDIEGATGMLDPLRDFLTDAGLGNVVHELEQLAEQANQLKQQLAAAASGTHWTGAAANGFRARARQRETEVAQLVGSLDSAHSAVAAAYAVAGIF